MKKFAFVLLMSAVIVLRVNLTARADFTLSGNMKGTVNTSHSSGNLYDQSQVDIVSGGEVGDLNLHGFSTANVISGNVTWVNANDSGTANIYDGYIESVDLQGTSTVNLFEGQVQNLYLWESGTANISGGSVQFLNNWDSGVVNLSGGVVGEYYTDCFYRTDLARATLSGGIVDTLWVDMAIEGNEQMTIDTAPTASFLERYGTKICGTTVNHTFWNTINTSDASSLCISSESIGDIYVMGDSSVNISGGQINTLHVNNLRPAGQHRVTISGGTVDTMGIGLILENDDQATISASPTTTTLSQYGASVSEGTVNNIIWETLSTYDNSTINVVCGYVKLIDAQNFSIVDISEGQADSLSFIDFSTAHITHSQAGNIYAQGSSNLNISGGQVNCITFMSDGVINLSDVQLSNFSLSGSGTVNLSGGQLRNLGLYGDGTIVFNTREFILGDGLTFDGNRILGEGTLSGTWFDGTPWMTQIYGNYGDATIMVVPEPITLGLLALGGLTVLRRKN